MTIDNMEYLKMTVFVSLNFMDAQKIEEVQSIFHLRLFEHAGFSFYGWHGNPVHHYDGSFKHESVFVYDSSKTFQDMGEHPAISPDQARLMLIAFINELCDKYADPSYKQMYPSTVMNIINISNTLTNVFINYIRGFTIMIHIQSEER